MYELRIVPFKPALILDGSKKKLIISDLHIGFENALLANNDHISRAIKDITQDVENIINDTKPNSLIILGDVKSSIYDISTNEQNDIAFFFEKITKKTNVTLIPGNHDGNIQNLLPREITITSSMGLIIDKILLTHGHVKPSTNLNVDKIIMGHIHPTFCSDKSILNGMPVWVSIKTNKDCLFPSMSGLLEITIIPSFNKYFRNVSRKFNCKSNSPILRRTKYLSAKIVSLDGTIIGDETIINNVI